LPVTVPANIRDELASKVRKTNCIFLVRILVTPSSGYSAIVELLTASGRLISGGRGGGWWVLIHIRRNDSVRSH